MSAASTSTARDRSRTSRRASRCPDRSRRHERLSERRTEYRCVRHDPTQLRRPSTTYDYASQDPINNYDLAGTISCPKIPFVRTVCKRTMDAARSQVSEAKSVGEAVVNASSTARNALAAAGSHTANALATASKDVAPYLGACLEGGTLGAIGGPEGALGGCIAVAVNHYTSSSRNPYVRYGGFAFAVVDAVATGNAVRLAQRNPARPFDLWSDLVRGGR